MSLVPGHDLSRVNAQPDIQGSTTKSGDGFAVPGVQLANSRRDCQAGTHRPQRIVFVSRWQAEKNSEIGVERLSDAPVKRLDCRFTERVVIQQHVSELLGIELLHE